MSSDIDTYVPRDDALLEVSSGQIPADSSTTGRSSIAFPAQTNGSGSLNQPLNDGTGKTTTFRLDTNPSQPFRWSTMGLRIRGKITKYQDTTANAPIVGGPSGSREGHQGRADQPYDSIDTFALAAAISQVRLQINGTNVWASTPGQYMATFMAGMLTNHSRQSLEHHPALFGPIFDDVLTAASARNGDATAGTPIVGKTLGSGTPEEPHRPGDVDTSGGPYFHMTQTALTAGAVAPSGTPPTGGGAGITEFVSNGSYTSNFTYTPQYNLASSENAMKRARKWIGQESLRRTVERIIPLADLTNIRVNGVLNNVRSIMLEIVWNNQDIMTHFSQPTCKGALGNPITGVPATEVMATQTWSQFNITNADIITDQYILSSYAFQGVAAEKLEGGVTRMPFEYIEVATQPFTANNQIVLPGKNNLQRLMVMNFAKGQSNGQTGNLAVTNSGTKNMVYNAWSQLLWIGNSACTDSNYPWMRRTNDETISGATAPATSIGITYNGMNYPMSDIITSPDNISFVGDVLYGEYLKAVARYDKHECTAAVDYETFCRTMPFLCVRPWSENGVHLSQSGGTLVIRPTGGVSGTNLHIVTMCIKTAEIDTNGACRMV